MIRHIVMFWLMDNSPENTERTVDILRSMKEKIPGMLTLEAGVDFNGSARSCDICLCEMFESREALEAYQTDPVHMPVKKHMHSVMERSASADFEVEA